MDRCGAQRRAGFVMSSWTYRLAPLMYVIGWVCMPPATSAAGVWVESVATSENWAAYACQEHLLSRVCDLDKDYSDPGVLPTVISVGAVVPYRNSRTPTAPFTLRAL